MAGANTLLVSQLILIVLLTICVHKKCFVQADGVSITVLGKEVTQETELKPSLSRQSGALYKQGNGLIMGLSWAYHGLIEEKFISAIVVVVW